MSGWGVPDPATPDPPPLDVQKGKPLRFGDPVSGHTLTLRGKGSRQVPSTPSGLPTKTVGEGSVLVSVESLTLQPIDGPYVLVESVAAL